MSSEITRKLFTFDDCLRMEEAGVLSPMERVELINGDILVVSPPGPRHGAAVDRTADEFRERLRGKALIRVQGTVVLDVHAAPLPDIALLKPRNDYYADKNPGPADIFLIVEVSTSSLDFDTTVKLALYAIVGIPEYWIADLENDRLLVYSDPVGDGYQSMRALGRGDSVAPTLLPDCRIPVDILLP
jgi:Uma2 family endonuclease